MFFDGYIRARITSASVMETLTAATQEQIALTDIQQLDELNALVSVKSSQYRKLERVMQKRKESLTILSRHGAIWRILGLRKRPVLLIGCAIMLGLMLYLPTRVLFVRVEGNASVSTVQILDMAESCGVYFGASRRELRSEEIKNKLLSAIPQLQWAGVNTSGCVAVISVREKAQPNEPERTAAVQSVVAARDGVIRQMSVLKGTALCKVGDAVTQGQVLVSGYSDYGIAIGVTAAQAEIYADTQRVVRAVSPALCVRRGMVSEQKTCYSLRIGKKLIKLCKDSGISDATCVKMKEEYDFILPGGFSLPLTLIVERIGIYEIDPFECSENDFVPWMEPALEKYLSEQMVAGSIRSGKCLPVFKNGAYYLYAEYSCFEMIGKIRNEEIVTNNEQRN